MEDTIRKATEGLRAWTVRLREGEADELLKRTVKSAEKAGVQVLVLKGNMVFGREHLMSALYHAKKAMDEQRNASDSLAMETLLYASGERQLSSAIKKMSVGPKTESAVVVQLTPGILVPEASWTTVADTGKDFDQSDLERFGISRAEIATVEGGKALELILERVAAVDILKK